METFPNLIAGDWTSSAHPFPVLDPYTGKTLGGTFFADEEQVERALGLAQRWFLEHSAAPAAERAALCGRIAQAIEARAEEFAQGILREAGKPITDARREVQRAVAVFRDAARHAGLTDPAPLPLDFPSDQGNRRAFLAHFPAGTVLAITPFNFPLNLVAHKVAPAIAFGCPFLLKPSPKTPLTALRLGKLLLEAGVPAESFSILSVTNPAIEKALLDPRIRVLSFTGSAPVGWRLKALVPKKKVLLELGGNAMVVVEPDADRDAALSRVVAGGFGYAGQSCISVQRVLVQESVMAPFQQGLLEKVRTLRMGDPSQETTQVGPLISEDAARRVESWVAEATQAGAVLLSGGRRKGSFYEPTVLAQVPASQKIACEEVFGPVIALESYREFDEALERVNQSPYGLQAGVYTHDGGKASRAFQRLEVGAVLINEVPTYRLDDMPYGGVKDSGFGREGARYTLETYTEPRLMLQNPL